MQFTFLFSFFIVSLHYQKQNLTFPIKKEEQSVTWGRKAVIENGFTHIQNTIKVAILDSGIYKRT